VSNCGDDGDDYDADDDDDADGDDDVDDLTGILVKERAPLATPGQEAAHLHSAPLCIHVAFSWRALSLNFKLRRTGSCIPKLQWTGSCILTLHWTENCTLKSHEVKSEVQQF
jgi:hypothetical protein